MNALLLETITITNQPWPVDHYKLILLDETIVLWLLVQCVPRKGFGIVGTAVCVLRDRKKVYIVSQTADPSHFGGTVTLKTNLS